MNDGLEIAEEATDLTAEDIEEAAVEALSPRSSSTSARATDTAENAVARTV